MCIDSLEGTAQGITHRENQEKKNKREWQGGTTQQFYTYSRPKKDKVVINRIAVNEIRMGYDSNRTQFQHIPEVFHNVAPTIGRAKRLRRAFCPNISCPLHNLARVIDR